MERINYSWQCPHCGRRDRNAHLSGIRDFMLMNGKNSISNGEFRDWVGLESKYSANKLLTRSGLKPAGNGHKRIYVVDWNFLVLINNCYYLSVCMVFFANIVGIIDYHAHSVIYFCVEVCFWTGGCHFFTKS